MAIPAFVRNSQYFRESERELLRRVRPHVGAVLRPQFSRHLFRALRRFAPQEQVGDVVRRQRKPSRWRAVYSEQNTHGAARLFSPFTVPTSRTSLPLIFGLAVRVVEAEPLHVGLIDDDGVGQASARRAARG